MATTDYALNVNVTTVSTLFTNASVNPGDVDGTTLNGNHVLFGAMNPGMDDTGGNFTGPPEDPASGEVIVLLSLLFCVIGSVGLIGNSLVIIVILLDRKMRQSVTNIFIMNLAVADFLIMAIGVPEIVQFMMNKGWLLGETACKVNRFVMVVALYVSILSLVSVCIERFVAIVYPIQAHILCGRKKIIVAIALIWPISIGCGLPTLWFNTLAFPHPSVPYEHCMIRFPELRHHTIFNYVQFAVFYFAPVVIQVILYAIIGKKLYASTDELHTRFQMRPSDSKYKNDKTSETIRARKAVVKMLASSVLVYIVCYAPPQIALIYDTVSSKAFPVTWSFRVFGIVISNINSAANPVLYSIFSQNFRRNFKKCLCYICIRETKEYHRTGFDSFESRSLTRKVSSSRTTTISRL